MVFLLERQLFTGAIGRLGRRNGGSGEDRRYSKEQLRCSDLCGGRGDGQGENLGVRVR